MEDELKKNSFMPLTLESASLHYLENEESPSYCHDNPIQGQYVIPKLKAQNQKKLPRLSNDGLILRSSLHATVAASSHVRPRKWLRLSRGCAEAPPRPRHRPRSKLSLPTPTYGKFSRRLLVEVEVAAPLSNPWCVVIELLSSFDFVRSQSSLGQDG